jgi:hypothetical protein
MVAVAEIKARIQEVQREGAELFIPSMTPAVPMNKQQRIERQLAERALN